MGIEVVHRRWQAWAATTTIMSPAPCTWRPTTRPATAFQLEGAAARHCSTCFQYLLTRKGPLAGNVFESVAFLRTDPSLEKPDVQFVFQPAKRLTNPKIPFPLGHGYAISPVALYPKSRGTVRLGSRRPGRSAGDRPAPARASRRYPAADPRAEDRARGLRQPRPSPNMTASKSRPGRSARATRQWDAYIRETGYTVHHPVGTCRMGDPRRRNAWSIPQLRVNGIEGLRVADASVMPSVIGGNTNAPCVMIGERCADFVLGKPRLPAAQLPPESVARYKPGQAQAANGRDYGQGTYEELAGRRRHRQPHRRDLGLPGRHPHDHARGDRRRKSSRWNGSTRITPRPRGSSG